ncbi:head-tail connector protein [Enterococcus avium]|uniref:head-tail connector protein n=1 Tax=Enterococcus avium TaxID=33945 RepID=UPI002890C4A4|nr:head-tail connector protein [Enterococcus avium]MDT2428738.1 head-tail connector protein [Enterococcus avium]
MILDPKTDLEEIKNSLKIDTDDDDQEVKRSVIAATAYVKGAIGTDKPSFYMQDNDTVELINLAILQLADHYYKARSATVSGNLREYDLGFTSLILQLKASYLLFVEEE